MQKQMTATKATGEDCVAHPKNMATKATVNDHGVVEVLELPEAVKPF